MSTIKYPADLDTNRNDFIKFKHFKYELNEKLKGRYDIERSPYALPPREDDSNDIVLYMPNSTPSTQYGQSATYQTFAGPLGNVLQNSWN